MIPVFTWKESPGVRKGFLLVISSVPFIPPGPYNADEAPESNSILSISSSLGPMMAPTEKFRPGAWLSIPSTSWLNLGLPLALNPLVVGVLKVREEVVTSTPFRLAMIS
jgi:hypothetical protein